MSEPGRKVFVDLVMSSRPDQFQPTDLPLLVRYAEAAALAEKAEGEIARKPLVKGKASPWVGILGQTHCLTSLEHPPHLRCPASMDARSATMRWM